MRAEVKTHFDGDPLVHPLPDGDGVWIETKVVAPPSSVGRSVELFVPAEMVTKLLIEFRQSAIKARSKHEGTP